MKKLRQKACSSLISRAKGKYLLVITEKPITLQKVKIKSLSYIKS